MKKHLLAALLCIAGSLSAQIFQAGSSIVFQGDSITDGNWGRNQADLNHVFGHGYMFLIASQALAENPALNLRFFNRGISGSTVTDLEKRWQRDTLALEPDVLSILVGINDTNRAVEQKRGPEALELFEKTYDTLIETTLKAHPGIKIILGEPFFLQTGKYKGEAWEARRKAVDARRAIVEKLAAKHKLPLIRYQKMFDEACARAPAVYWIWDDVHPTPAGHWLMAAEWKRTWQTFYGPKQPVL